MTWPPHWHSLPPSQTGSNAGRCVGPPRRLSLRCCCEAPGSDDAERGGVPTCGQSLLLRRWCGKLPGGVVWGRRWSGRSVQLRDAEGNLPRRHGSSGRRCGGGSSRPRCGGWPLTQQRVRQRLHRRGHCMLHDAAECSRPRRSNPPATDRPLTICSASISERKPKKYWSCSRKN